jgi:hypothetical protein
LAVRLTGLSEAGVFGAEAALGWDALAPGVALLGGVRLAEDLPTRLEQIKTLAKERGIALTDDVAERLAGSPFLRLTEEMGGLSDVHLPGMSRPIRLPSPEFPPDPLVVDAMHSPLLQEMAGNGSDCSEIAERLLTASNGNGFILRVEPNKRFELQFFENGKVEVADHHEVFSDGRYVYDPRVSEFAVPYGDWLQHMIGMNPNGISVVKKKV